MVHLLLEESLEAESLWRPIASSSEPMFAEIPVERVDPDPKNKRHWTFATDNEKILAHIYKPDYVLQKFEEVVVPLFDDAYGRSFGRSFYPQLARRLVQDTIFYLFFHELFHSIYCPKSKGKSSDEEKFDVALVNGIKRAEPNLSPRDLSNKAGNCRNALWDFVIDTFFSHFTVNGGHYDQAIRRTLRESEASLDHYRLDSLPDGVVITWDVLELADHQPQTLFYPITRATYSLLHCDHSELRERTFSYFEDKMKGRISTLNLEQAIVGALSGAVKYISDAELFSIGSDRTKFIEAVSTLYHQRAQASATAARREVLRTITQVNLRPELRYRSVEGIIEPWSKYISLEHEERRDGANVGSGGEGDNQTPTSQAGGGAEQVLQSLINQGNPSIESMIASIANDQSAPRNNRNQRLSNLAKDEYYKQHARELPIRSPIIEAETVVVGKIKIPVKVSERLLTIDQLLELPMDEIVQFQLQTGLDCLTRLSPHQWRYDIYEWQEQPIVDFDYKFTGIILPDYIIFRVDQSGSMELNPSGGSTSQFVGSKNRYDGLTHMVYGVTKSAAKAAASVKKEVSVVIVGYSEEGKTVVSPAVELQTFLHTPNNPAKQVLLNPSFGGSTHHDLSAYQLSYLGFKPGKTVDITITDGDLDTDHDRSIAEVRRILDVPGNVMVYFPVFQEGAFAQRIQRLATTKPNLTYHPFMSFDRIQSTANDIIIQYRQSDR